MEALIEYKSFKKCVMNDFPYPIDWEDDVIEPYWNQTWNRLLQEHSNMNDPYFCREGKPIINLKFIDHYIILGFRLANLLWKNNLEHYSEAIYYSYRVRGAIDLFYRTDIGPYFLPNHTMGSVIDSHAKYGKLLFIMNGIHIGPYNILGKDASELNHPVIGDYVTLMSKCSIFGKTTIGNNVIISNNALIINEEIPDNCIVYGQSPNLFFAPLKTNNSTKLFNPELMI
jgi:serine O-acetyltransferase